MKVDRDKVIYIDDIDGDGGIRLDVLEALLPKLQSKYGKRAVLCFDGGYNNVQVAIKPSRHNRTSGYGSWRDRRQQR